MTTGLQPSPESVSTTDSRPLAIRARGLDVGYPAKGGVNVVLTGLDLEVREGEFLTIIGPSGCGKSTLLRVVADLLSPAAGSLEVFGDTPAAARRRRDIGFVFQDSTLLPWRTVMENLRLPDEVGKKARAGRPGAEGPDAAELLRMIGLAGRENAYPHQLSGGQRQRVAIARALLSRPRILLMDEPFGALDEITRDRLNDELLGLWQSMRMTILFVTHSVMEAAYLGDRVAILASNPGRLRELEDIRAAKAAAAGPIREDPGFVRSMAHLRAVLRTC
ncbi:ABC transporter ATP-binding protein [Mesorhizobium helmanticense]|uniref:ABC transporter ATP-binding protein n=1 Tax=Mesorhizobium helmanticense TaxID=1776423 RepID=A0A2T4IYZ1_9HYPH|nr:ABC transporter ATP-binding protein [Mesorhizobium helmanticense]PTE10832.1 ABC transporter ATP-binding protein [Mesorhizobium helmanticense]